MCEESISLKMVFNIHLSSSCSPYPGLDRRKPNLGQTHNQNWMRWTGADSACWKYQQVTDETVPLFRNLGSLMDPTRLLGLGRVPESILEWDVHHTCGKDPVWYSDADNWMHLDVEWTQCHEREPCMFQIEEKSASSPHKVVWIIVDVLFQIHRSIDNRWFCLPW